MSEKEMPQKVPFDLLLITFKFISQREKILKQIPSLETFDLSSPEGKEEALQHITDLLRKEHRYGAR